MPLRTLIVDPNDLKSARVTDAGELRVTSSPYNVILDVGTENQYRYFSDYLRNDAGSASMNVNGSVNPQQFILEPAEDADIFIMRIAIILVDGNVAHNTFGQQSALTNGWDIFVEDSGLKTYFVEKAKTGGEVIAQTGFANPWGNSGTSWELTSWTGQADATVAVLPINEFIPGGIRLGRGTYNKIEAIVNDDLTGMNDFLVRIFGYQHFEVKI